MIGLKAKIRKEFRKKMKAQRAEGIIPAVLYGEGINNTALSVNLKEFKNIFEEAGESSLISLELNNKKFEVLIHKIARNPLTGEFLHIDFYHPSTEKEVEAEISLSFEGNPLAVKELGGVLVKEIQALEVKGLARNLPREIKVDISRLKTFEDRILIEDIDVPVGVKIMQEPKEIVALVTPPAEEEVDISGKNEEETEEKSGSELKGKEQKQE